MTMPIEGPIQFMLGFGSPKAGPVFDRLMSKLDGRAQMTAPNKEGDAK